MAVLSGLKKILIANRGEIACRIIRSAKKLGIKTVAVYSEVDLNSMHVQMADEAFYIGPASAQDSYLRGNKIIEAAKKSNASAIHPGYGFLSENAEFAELCTNSGIIFIGPPPSAIRDMGIKSLAKELMGNAGIPIVPGYHGNDQSNDRLRQEADKIGYPLMIKAVRGGGGKGMRIVKSETDFLNGLDSARRESLRAFGDQDVLLERYIERPRHVEVQVFGDKHGNYVHLFERDCSIQRRHQKIIEQAPAPLIDDYKRNELGVAGVSAARAVNYVGAGTVEFILDTKDSTFYFMEMNTRLQVEHPVTEMVTGVDLVEWQLRVAAGEPIPLKQDQLKLSGYAVEARIYAENQDFMPTAGKIEAISLPEGENVRVETGVTSGDEVTVHYDPMIAKLVVWHPDEKEVFSKMETSLKNFNIVGIENNVDFLRTLCSNKNLIDGNVHTGFIEENREHLNLSTPTNETVIQAAMGLILYEENDLKLQPTFDKNDPFCILGPFRINQNCKRNIKFNWGNKEYTAEILFDNDKWYHVTINNQETVEVRGEISKSDSLMRLKLFTPKKVKQCKIGKTNDEIYVFSEDGNHKFSVIKDEDLEDESLSTEKTKGEAVSPMPGIIEKVNVKVGDVIKKGDNVAVIIAMKMEHIIKAEKDGKVASIHFNAGDNVPKNVPILTLEN
ncbi:methylcrotonoyl-CoA carboxylase subunit alpha, mitochondrial [Halyomorpha halys]|uniref:methylcrotonoyl-CoA carboxylase subunit alpha, mitochondrial n=1 Tax=Halyomorpha halys TaxID=286706 RepID=UPI0006D50F23|nr:methylcrotonoyl-CoA carboxylase subunit alpha, mitochondrial [Halyomorpha halys]XP_014277751.1 methylcrotonoyl-CoA carboxylase subunit alpha, mitochondrial [Halyomorpha halys]